MRVLDYYFSADSCRNAAYLYTRVHMYIHDVTGVWNKPVRIRAECVPQTSVAKPRT